MILDRVENLGQYAGVIPHAAALAGLWAEELMDTAPCEVRHKDYLTKEDGKRRFEVHAHTIDLMIGLDGAERIHICDPARLTPAEPLPNGADGMKLDGAPCGSSVLLEKGTFVAIFPGEAHMVAGHPDGESVPLSKLVLKIPC